jgi:hypothetical protein
MAVVMSTSAETGRVGNWIGGFPNARLGSPPYIRSSAADLSSRNLSLA